MFSVMKKDKIEKISDIIKVLILLVINNNRVVNPEMKATKYIRNSVILVKKNRIIVVFMIREMIMPHKQPLNNDVLLPTITFLAKF